MNIKLLVNNFEIGEYKVLVNEWDINLKQKEYTKDYDIVQVMYYILDWGNFFAVYSLVDENEKIDYYLIDSREIPEKVKEYNAVKIPEEQISKEDDIHKFVIKLILTE